MGTSEFDDMQSGDYWVRDVGVDGRAASAEEPAICISSDESAAVFEFRPRGSGCRSGLFDVDVKAQAPALAEFDSAPVSLGLCPLVRARHDRIVLTGMGGSHFAALPSWRRLVSRGWATRWIDAGRLLESPELVTPDSLLVVTSRSGMSGEAVALVERFDEASRPAAIVAITDNLNSPLAEAADCEILLRSQSSGSTKGFLNALAAHGLVVTRSALSTFVDQTNRVFGGDQQAKPIAGWTAVRRCHAVDSYRHVSR